MVGQSRKALALLEQAKARDPLAPGVAQLLVHAHANLGDFRAAMAEADRAFGLDGGGRTTTAAAALTQALGERNRAEILRWLDAGSVAGAADPIAPDFTARMKQLLDQQAEALAYLRTLAQEHSASAATPSAVAVYQAYFGDPEAAIESVRLTRERGLPAIVALTLWNPVMRDARRLPEFRQLVRDFGLVEYWERFGWGDICKPVGDDFECD